MSVYCGFLNESIEAREPEITLESFTNFLFESELEMSALFERATIFTALNEETTALAIPSTISFDGATSTEEVKKTVVQKIKEVFAMLAKAIKDGVEKLIEKVQEMYMKTNLTDKFVSQFKGLTTYENLQKCRTAGWQGIPISLPSVISLADPTDSEMQRMKDNPSIYGDIPEIEKDIDPILTAPTIAEARDIYKKFEAKNSRFRDRAESTFGFTIHRSTDSKRGFLGSDPKKNPYYGYFQNGNDDKHYYPTPETFAITKQLAERGQNDIKQAKNSFNKSIDTLRTDRTIALDNMKSYIGKGSNKADDKETNQISILYYKARYQYSVSMISRAKQIYQAMFQIIARQHHVAIQQYFLWVSAIKRYVKPEKAEA